jgi:hypothetical protein
MDARPLLPLDDKEFDDVENLDNKWTRRNISRHSQIPCTFNWRSIIFAGLLLALWVLSAVASSAAFHYYQRRHYYDPQITFSPAQSEIEYIVQNFQQNISEASVAFRDPLTVDDAWDDLYNGMLTTRFRYMPADNPSSCRWIQVIDLATRGKSFAQPDFTG